MTVPPHAFRHFPSEDIVYPLSTIAKSGSLFIIILTVAGLTPAVAQFTGVLTQHNDNARTGQNLNETILTPQNLSARTFGKVFSFSVDGQIYGQPLYVPKVSIPGLGLHNVVYVATQNDSLYAFDADYRSPTALWQVSFVNPAVGITPVLCTSKTNPNVTCNVYPMTGINSTPVIDPITKTIYLVTRSQKGNTFFQTLHAIDIMTGAEKFGGPVNISGSVPGTGTGSINGTLTFPTNTSIQRPALLLANGTIYIGWAVQHGWIMSYDATTLQQKSILSTTPNSAGGGVWSSGNGMAADASGNIYVATGNGGFDFDTGGVDFGDTLAKFDPNMNLLDYFTPLDQACRGTNDRDLGAGGPMLLPTQPGSAPNELLISGKGGLPCDTNPPDSIAYLLNQNTLGEYNPIQDQDVEEVIGSAAGYFSSPAYWQGPGAAYVYFGGIAGSNGQGDNLKMYSVTNGLLSSTPVSQSSNLFPVGVTPSISASISNGVPANGIVWAVERPDALGLAPGISPAVLYAYDATNLGTMLYNSTQAVLRGGLRDGGGCANKFAVPTIANGRVYVGTQNELDVFGRLSFKTAPNVYLANPCWKFPVSVIGTPVSQAITLENTGNAALTVNSLAISGFRAADFSQTNTCTTLAPGGKCVITVTFTASTVGPESGYVMINDNAIGSPHNIYVIGIGKN